MNWGGFAGGFAQGFGNGVAMGKTIKSIRREKELEDIRAQGIMEANAARERDIAGSINDTGVPDAKAADGAKVAEASPVETAKVETRELPPIGAAQDTKPTAVTPVAAGGITPQSSPDMSPQSQPIVAQKAPASLGLNGQPAEDTKPMGRYVVGDQRFETPDAARSFAEKRVGSTQDYILKTIVPKLQEKYIQYGDIENAEKLGQYMESRKGQEATKVFGRAMTSMMAGDTEGGIKAFGEYYNRFVDDGVDFKKHSIGEDGKINFTLARKSDGKEFDMSLTRGELLRLGMAHDPAKLYASVLDAQKAKEQQAAEVAKEDRKLRYDVARDDRKASQQERLEGIKQKGRLEEKAVEAELDMAKIGVAERRRLETQRNILKENGFGDDDIKRMTPALLKINEHKKTTDPDERRAIVTSELIKSDMNFPRLSEADQRKKVDQVMRVMNIDSSSGSQTTTPQSPLVTQSNMKPMLDTRTGKVVMRPAN